MINVLGDDDLLDAQLVLGQILESLRQRSISCTCESSKRHEFDVLLQSCLNLRHQVSLVDRGLLKYHIEREEGALSKYREIYANLQSVSVAQPHAKEELLRQIEVFSVHVELAFLVDNGRGDSIESANKFNVKEEILYARVLLGKCRRLLEAELAKKSVPAHLYSQYRELMAKHDNLMKCTLYSILGHAGSELVEEDASQLELKMRHELQRFVTGYSGKDVELRSEAETLWSDCRRLSSSV